MSVEVSSLQCINKVFAYPLMNNAYSNATELLERMRSDYPTAIGAPYNVAESGLGVVRQLSAPLLTKAQPGVALLDGMMCNQLQKLETQFPIVTEPVDEVKSQSWKFYEERVSPGVELVRLKPYEYTRAALGLPERLASKTLLMADYYTDCYLPAIIEAGQAKSTLDTIREEEPDFDLLTLSHRVGWKLTQRLQAHLQQLVHRLSSRGVDSLRLAREQLRALEQVSQLVQLMNNGAHELSHELAQRWAAIRAQAREQLIARDGCNATDVTVTVSQVQAAMRQRAAHYMEALHHLVTVLSTMVYDRLDADKQRVVSETRRAVAELARTLNDRSQSFQPDFFAMSQSTLNIVQQYFELAIERLQQYYLTPQQADDNDAASDAETTDETQ